jgi:hypothetical protein
MSTQHGFYLRGRIAGDDAAWDVFIDEAIAAVEARGLVLCGGCGMDGAFELHITRPEGTANDRDREALLARFGRRPGLSELVAGALELM